MSSPIDNTTFTESFWSHDDDMPYVSSENRANALRSQLLQALRLGEVNVAPVLLERLQQAQEVAELWFLRIDIMQALSVHLSEERAGLAMGEITKLFVGHMPESVFKASNHAIRTQNASHSPGSGSYWFGSAHGAASGAGPSNPAPPAAHSTRPPGP